MFISIEPIVGISLGVEYIEEENAHYFIIDLGLLRILVEKFKESS